MLASKVVDHRLEPSRVKHKTIKLAFAASLLSSRLMCPGGTTCIPPDQYPGKTIPQMIYRKY